MPPGGSEKAPQGAERLPWSGSAAKGPVEGWCSPKMEAPKRCETRICRGLVGRGTLLHGDGSRVSFIANAAGVSTMASSLTVDRPDRGRSGQGKRIER